MTTAAKEWFRSEVAERELVVSRPGWHPAGKTDAMREETGKRISWATAARIQAPGERLAEITSGRAISQQGLAATCKDPGIEAQSAEGTERVLVRRMSSYER